jgi:hypothetical protein
MCRPGDATRNSCSKYSQQFNNLTSSNFTKLMNYIPVFIMKSISFIISTCNELQVQCTSILDWCSSIFHENWDYFLCHSYWYICSRAETNIVTELLALLLHIWEIPVSNLSMKTGHHSWNFSLFSSVSPGKFCGNTFC